MGDQFSYNLIWEVLAPVLVGVIMIVVSKWMHFKKTNEKETEQAKHPTTVYIFITMSVICAMFVIPSAMNNTGGISAVQDSETAINSPPEGTLSGDDIHLNITVEPEPMDEWNGWEYEDDAIVDPYFDEPAIDYLEPMIPYIPEPEYDPYEYDPYPWEL